MIEIHDTTLTDFEPGKIRQREAEKAEEQKVMDLLGRFTAEMLKDALRNEGGHPKPEWGEGETWRFYYLDECSRRGRRFLEQLGWPTDENALYVNLHTGNVETLLEISTDCWSNQRKENPLDYRVWLVIEHWEPYDPDEPNKYLIAYLEEQLSRLRKIKAKGKLNTYDKGDVRHIPEYEKEIETEKLKNKG